MKRAGESTIIYEKELVRRCIAGEKSAWDEFVDSYKNLVHSTIIRAFSSIDFTPSEAVHDVFQDVFVLLLKNDCRKLRSFKWKNGCSIVYWLYVIAKNLAFDYMRKAILRRKTAVAAEKEDGSVEELLSDKGDSRDRLFEAIQNKERMRLFEKAVKELPREDVYLIELLYFRGLAPNRAAAIMGKKVDALYMQRNRLIAKMKKIIEKYTEAPKSGEHH